MPVQLQKCHLLDIWHLDKAHWFTLHGVQVKEVFQKSPELVRFNLQRFGRTQEVKITQDNNKTEVNVNNCILKFVIEDVGEDHHYLNVELFSHYKSLKLIRPLIQLVFFLTVIEDMIYYEN
jgi:hypothetical protein